MRSLLALTIVCVTLAPLSADDWTGYRGPNRNGLSKEAGLLKEWPKGGPKLVFQSKDAGKGYAGLAIVKGVVYTMGAFDNDEYALAIDNKGKLTWKTKIGPVHDWKANSWSHGPNATPTVDGDLVYCLSSKGMFLCVDTAGKEKWKVDLVKDMGGIVDDRFGGFKNLGWGYSVSPIVDGDKLYLVPGGPKGTFAALDKKKGTVLWRSKGITEVATYSTPALATIHGVKQLVYFTKRGVIGVSTEDGKLLWEFKRDEDSPDVVSPSPIVSGDMIYASIGYGAPALGLKIKKGDKGLSAEVVYSETVIGNKQTGVALLDKHIYGYHEDRAWSCVELATGKSVWPRSKQTIKAGGMVIADGRIYTVDESGQVAMLAASPTKYALISSVKLPEQSKLRKSQGGLYTYPALSDGKLYARDQELIFCYEVK